MFIAGLLCAALGLSSLAVSRAQSVPPSHQDKSTVVQQPSSQVRINYEDPSLPLLVGATTLLQQGSDRFHHLFSDVENCRKFPIGGSPRADISNGFKSGNSEPHESFKDLYLPMTDLHKPLLRGSTTTGLGSSPASVKDGCNDVLVSAHLLNHKGSGVAAVTQLSSSTATTGESFTVEDTEWIELVSVFYTPSSLSGLVYIRINATFTPIVALARVTAFRGEVNLGDALEGFALQQTSITSDVASCTAMYIDAPRTTNLLKYTLKVRKVSDDVENYELLTSAVQVDSVAAPTSLAPSAVPTAVPSAGPTDAPTLEPSPSPVAKPSAAPSALPTAAPTTEPSLSPVAEPSAAPSAGPTDASTLEPSPIPVAEPSDAPSAGPTDASTLQPSPIPVAEPSDAPSAQPTAAPTSEPSLSPVAEPSAAPSAQPKDAPTTAPSLSPVAEPSAAPSAGPTDAPTTEPSPSPMAKPSAAPSAQPTAAPTTEPSLSPVAEPSAAPSAGPTDAPTLEPSPRPAAEPSADPSAQPTDSPTTEPSPRPAAEPSDAPSAGPTVSPTAKLFPSPVAEPSAAPSLFSTLYPTNPTASTTANPSIAASTEQTAAPTGAPTAMPTVNPAPSGLPSTAPRNAPTMKPTVPPTDSPISAPSESPSEVPTVLPSDAPIAAPSVSPTVKPSDVPTERPTERPSTPLSAAPSAPPSVLPTAVPSEAPTVRPSAGPSAVPSRKPSAAPTVQATDAAGVFVPATPQLGSVVFGGDGTNVLVSFTSDTNKAGYSSHFACTTALSFTGASTASCSWTSASAITIYPSSATLNVGSSVALISNSGLRAACPASVSTAVCALWSEVPAVSVFIEVPVALTTPVVSLVVPNTLIGGGSMPVDLTASSGSCGRAWQSAVFTVTSNQSDGAAAAEYLNAHYIFSGAFYAPSSLFPATGLYTIGVTLTNFLGAAAQTSASVNVNKAGLVYPTVLIPGLKSRSVLTSSVLSLTPSAYVSDCAGVQTTTGLANAWTVTMDGIVQTALTSTSSDPSKFRLPAYSLAPLSIYDILVTVTNTATGRTGTATVSVTVQRDSLVAQVAGGSAQSITGEGSLSLDASSSYDQDKAVVAGVSNGLTYAWTCAQTLPSAGTCPLTVTDATLASYVVTATSDAAGSTSAVTVTVADSETGRTSSTTVLVSVQNVAAPQVAITSTAQSVTSINVDNRLNLAASVTSQSSCTAQWSVDASTVSLASSALSALVTPIPSGATLVLNLVLVASALPKHASLIFTLACGESSAAITVTTNGPPLPGQFAISPASGVELSTSFAFSASFWSDTDLPITYQFGFLPSSGGSTLTVRVRSESSSTATTLPAGSSTGAYAVTGSVLVYDVLNAVSSASAVTTVTPQTNIAELQASLVAQLTATFGNVDATKSAISIGSAVINAVSCAAAPACAPLNRASCAKVQNTCGACLTGYLGDAGDKNSQCASATSTGGLPVGSTCAADSDCGGFLACDTALAAPVCYLPKKRCTDDCSGRGTCAAFTTSSNRRLDSCFAGDPSCVVSCECDLPFTGATCAVTDEEMTQRRALRSQYLQSVATVVAEDDADSESVVALADSLAALAQNSYELTSASANLTAAVADSILAAAASLGDVPYDRVKGVLSAVDSATAARVRLSAANAFAFDDPVMDAVTRYTNIVSSQLVVGQNAVESVHDTFRLSTLRAAPNYNNTVQIVSPSTLLEESNGDYTSSASIRAASGGSRVLSAGVGTKEEFAVNMVVTAAASYGEEGSSFNSNPVRLTVAPTAGSLPIEVIFVLAHNEAANFTTKAEALAWAFNFTCLGGGDQSVHNHTCPGSGRYLERNCSGLFGVQTMHCPVRVPSCATVDRAAGTINANASDCRVVTYDLHRTICACVIKPRAEATVYSRRLAGTELQQTGLLDAVSVTVYVGSEFKDTFNSYDDINSLAALKRVLIVIIMFCAMWVFGFILISVCTWRRNAMKAANAKKNDHLEKKVAVAEVSRSPAAVQQYLADYLNQTFPSVFSNKPFFSRLYGEIKRHHRYLTLFTAPEGETGDKQRILAGVQLLTAQTMMMFLIAMLYDVESPSDDGSCPGHADRDACMDRKSVFDTTATYCDWTEGGTCEYRDPVFSLKATLYITVIVAILTAIISYPSDYIFELLSAPVAQESTIKQVSRQASRRVSDATPTAAKTTRKGQVAGAVTVKLPGATEAAHALATASMTVIAENSRRTIMNRQMTRMRSYQASGGKYGVLSADGASSSDSDSDSDNSDDDSDNNVGAFSDEVRAGEDAAPSSKNKKNAVSKPANEMRALLSKLSEEVHCQRRLLKPSEVEEFDTQWGLDPTGEYTLGERSVVPCLSGRPGAEETLLRELTYVKEESKETAEMLSDATDAHTGLEILHLFIKDLLGRGTPAAIIFETKSEEDFQHTKVVTRNTKYFAGFALFCINAFFVYYSILTGFRKGVHWQQIFLVACIVQFIVEVVLFETMEVMWINCAVPTLVSDEVRAVGESIIEVVQHLCNETPAESRLFLNAPDYLFVSTNVAKQYPHLMESIMVQAYNTHLPGELARKWQTGSIARMHRRRRRRNVTMVGMFFRALQHVGTMPFLVHRMVIRFIQPFVLTGLALLWQIIVSNVIYITVAVFVLLMILAYGLYRSFQEKALIKKSGSITPMINMSSDIENQNISWVVIIPESNANGEGEVDHAAEVNEEKSQEDDEEGSEVDTFKSGMIVQRHRTGPNYCV